VNIKFIFSATLKTEGGHSSETSGQQTPLNAAKTQTIFNHVLYTKSGIYDLNCIIIMVPFCNVLSERRGPIIY